LKPERQTQRDPKRVLAVAAGGGHWTQLQRLKSAFQNEHVVYVTVNREYQEDIPGEKLYTVRDASRWNKIGIIIQALQVAWIVLRERPDVVLSTGASQGYFALRVGKFLGARTIWIDSIANAGEMSMSGRLAGPYADLWLTQWSHLETTKGPSYKGSVLEGFGCDGSEV
jgi:UDP-N-acetylglucosamine:LPS N-acetylglucosamine transferase